MGIEHLCLNGRKRDTLQSLLWSFWSRYKEWPSLTRIYEFNLARWLFACNTRAMIEARHGKGQRSRGTDVDFKRRNDGQHWTSRFSFTPIHALHLYLLRTWGLFTVYYSIPLTECLLATHGAVGDRLLPFGPFAPGRASDPPSWSPRSRTCWASFYMELLWGPNGSKTSPNRDSDLR